MKNVRALRATDESLATMMSRVASEHPEVKTAIIIGFSEDGEMYINYYASDSQLAMAGAQMLKMAVEEY